MSDWKEQKTKFRGGGDLGDALLLLANAREDVCGSRLREVYHPRVARDVLCLPSGLRVPDGPECVKITHFNADATSGPFLRRFGVRKKEGLQAQIEETVWRLYDMVGKGEMPVENMPWVTARLGYRTKLLSEEKALRSMSEGKALGRAVMMMDAIEQATSAPLYSVLDDHVAQLHSRERSPWANKVVRASSMWKGFYKEIKRSRVVLELDWKKFDLERPSDDILFVIEVICSCFEPRSVREERLLNAYKLMLRRALVDRVVVLDNGTCFKVDGMVPSGSLWTGWLDTALNILYLTHAFQSVGIDRHLFIPKCAGDDNLTLFECDVSDEILEQGRIALNTMFNAGIEKEEFLIHRGPYYVYREQACFPLGVDVSKGTSDKLHLASWVPFTGEMVIDQAAGKSHRWRFHYAGKPKFLSCYWLRNGLPIRPAYDSKERILWPEGIHSTLEEYEEAVLAMVVDNPFNDHTVNQMMHRYLIIQEIKRQACTGVRPDTVVWYSKFRDAATNVVPYPSVGYWRRQDEWVDLENAPKEKEWIRDFRQFQAEITSLYIRNIQGKIDAWLFMDVIRGKRELPAGQIGADLLAWLQHLTTTRAASHLRAIRRYRSRTLNTVHSSISGVEGISALRRLEEGCLNGEWPSPMHYCNWLLTHII